jgi:hypothetical protein
MTAIRTTSLALAAAISIAGCEEIPDRDTREQHATSSNALSLNALSLNALSLNALSLNALSLNALSLNSLAPGSYALHPDALRALEVSPDAVQILGYVARCALASGTELVATIDGETIRFPGLFGFAPSWLQYPIDDRAQRWMSGCLLAHANHFGVQVPISVRAAGAESTPTEWAAFPVYEASFFGNLLGDRPVLFACHGTSPDEALALSEDRELRVCSDPLADVLGETVCSQPELPVVNASGLCEATCKRKTDSVGYTSCGSFAEVVSVWLMGESSSAPGIDAPTSESGGPKSSTKGRTF